MKKTGKVISIVLGLLGGAIAGGTAIFKVMGKTVSLKEQKRMKFKSYYETTNQWLLVKNQGKSLERYFVDNGYKTMAIYGMGELGNRLYEELNQSEKIQIKYAIDENAENLYSDLKVASIDERLEDVDVVVVTAIFDFEDISNSLEERINCPIVSLEDVVFEV